jgi:hypothetical protein
MTHLRTSAIAAAALFAIAFAPVLHADVRTQERTKFELGGMLGKVAGIFGGKAARDGVVTTVALKGSRLATLSDSTGQIVDLSEEKVYELDIRRKTYRVRTFAEIRQQMEEARAKAQKAMQEEQAKAPEAPASQPPAEAMEIDFDVQKTGQSRTINGFNTEQAKVIVSVREKGKTLEQSGGLQITTDLWLAPSVPALKEIADFHLQYAQKLYGPMLSGASPQDMAAAMALYPMLAPALEKMNAEKNKLEGTAILTTVTVEGVKSAEQLALEQQQRQQSSTPNVSGGIGGLIGGLARRKAQQQIQGDPQPRATVMTTTSEVMKVSTSVADADVALPAGFKQQ